MPTYSLVGGADQVGSTINSTTGALSFIAVPDFEAPRPFRRQQQLYRAGAGLRRLSSDTQIITVTVTNVGDVTGSAVITSNGGGDNASVSVAENSTTVTTVTATDADGTPLFDCGRSGPGPVHDQFDDRGAELHLGAELRGAGRFRRQQQLHRAGSGQRWRVLRHPDHHGQCQQCE